MRKNNYLLLFLLLCLQFNLSAQTTFIGDVVLTSQAEVDDFPSNYTTIDGSLTIGGPSGNTTVSLAPLSNLTTITGDLYINGVSFLTNLDGLDNLSGSVNNLTISNNPSLQNIDAIAGITGVNGDLTVRRNRHILTVDALINISEVPGDLNVSSNDDLTSIDGLNSITSVGGNLSLERNESITAMSGMNALTSVGGYFFLEDNRELLTIDGFNGLISVGTENDNNSGLIFNENEELLNINGFASLENVYGNFFLVNHDNSLTVIDGFNSLSYVGNFTIRNNRGLTSLTGFNSLATSEDLEVSDNRALQTISGFGSLITINGEFRISDNRELLTISDFGSLATVGDNFSIDRNKKLIQVGAMPNLTQLGGGLRIWFCDVLQDVDFLSSLTTIGDDIHFWDLPTITNVLGLSNVVSVATDLRFTSCDNLQTLDGLENITSISDLFQIYGCTSLTDVSGLDNLNYIGGNFSVHSNPLLDECCAFATVIKTPGAIGGNFFSLYNNGPNCSEVATIEYICDADGDNLSPEQGDCDDLDPNNFPGNAEVCDGQDNNCDGLVDEDDPAVEGANWYADTDGDGFGDPTKGIISCNPPANFVMDNTDNCADIANPDQTDADCDNVGDACDLCPGGDDTQDSDGDGIPDCADWDGFNNLPAAWKCGNNKVTICHIPPGNPANAKTKCVNKNSVSSHLSHGDYLGPCYVVSCNSLLSNNTNNYSIPKSINEFISESAILFPNPASDQITLQLERPTAGLDIIQIEIFSIDGRSVSKIKQELEGQSSLDLNIQGLNTGTYFVKILLGTDDMIVKQFVKI